MKYSSRFSVALHCMLLIALYGGQDRLTSERIAKSTGCNAVTIRSVFGQLQQAGLISVRRGPGGVLLERAPEAITLWDIYTAVEPEQVPGVPRMHPNPFPLCPVGKCIGEVLQEPYEKIGAAVETQLRAYTLQQLKDRFEQVSEAKK